MAKHQVIGGIPILSQESILAAKRESAIKLMVHQFIAATQPAVQPPELPALQAIARVAPELRKLPALVGVGLQQATKSFILAACYSKGTPAGQDELMKAFLFYMMVTGRVPKPELLSPTGDMTLNFEMPDLDSLQLATHG